MNILEKYRLNPVQVFSPKGLAPHSYSINSGEVVGIEVEVENVVHAYNIPRGSPWVVASDNSLRNSGMEFVSRPIAASDAPASLNQLLTQILVQDCHFSPRTSVHIHLNAQNMEPHQVVNLVLVYGVFERLFYKFAGRGRFRNIFCVPITETNLMNFLAEKGVDAQWSKYTGLNLLPLRPQGDSNQPAYGTIEFRQMHGTFSVEKLCLWIDMITCLKGYIMKSETKDVRAMILGMDDDFNFDLLLHEIFGTKADILKLCSIDEVKNGYLCAKVAMTSAKNVRAFHERGSKDSPFYQFKG